MAYEIDWDELNTKLKSFGTYLYWIAGLILAFSLSYVLFSNNKQVASILVFLLTTLALYYYYVKWIVIGDDFQIPSGNCPDMLVSKGFFNADLMQYVCVDQNGAFPDMDANAKTETLATLKESATESAVGKNGDVLTTKGIVITPSLKEGDDLGDMSAFCRLLDTNGMSWPGPCSKV